jgi:hypothetical protein
MDYIYTPFLLVFDPLTLLFVVILIFALFFLRQSKVKKEALIGQIEEIKTIQQIEEVKEMVIEVEEILQPKQLDEFKIETKPTLSELLEQTEFIKPNKTKGISRKFESTVWDKLKI